MNRVADKNGMIARRATPVAATTRYWRSQPFAGVAAYCHSRTRRFANRVMAAVILAPTIRCGRAVQFESGGSDLSRTKGLRPTVSRSLCQGAQHRERPFLSQPEGHWLCGRSAACGCDTLLRSSRLREQPLATPSRTGRYRAPCRGCYSLRRESPFASSPFLHPSRQAECAVMRDLISGSLFRRIKCIHVSCA